MKTVQMLEGKLQVWRESKTDDKKEVGEIRLGFIDSEVPKGHSGSDVPQTVGKGGLRLGEGRFWKCRVGRH
jgi:hypothetical protein